MIRLFTTLYPERNQARLTEYQECLRRNCSGAIFDEVCILSEGAASIIPRHPRVRIREIAARPLFDDFFHWINEVSSDDCYSVISNTDIWFTKSIIVALLQLKPSRCLALARWDWAQDGRLRLFDRNDSQDSWCFRGPVRRVRGDFPTGVPRCDNRMLYELQAAGYVVANPSFSVKTVHMHSGQRVEYGETGSGFVEPPYRYLWPHNLFGPTRTWLHNLRHPDRRLGWRIDKRKVAGTLLGRVLRKLSGTLGANPGGSAPVE